MRNAFYFIKPDACRVATHHANQMVINVNAMSADARVTSVVYEHKLFEHATNGGFDMETHAIMMLLCRGTCFSEHATLLELMRANAEGKC